MLIAVTLAAAFGGLTIKQALEGYADPSVWLVQAAFFISNALIGTGLARRIALFFVRVFGKSSLGISYALTLSDLVLAPAIPANGARSGGVILPIVRSISELYGSTPGATASLLGCFLFTAVYQGICVTAAMFYTGQASNPLAAQMAKSAAGVTVTITSWFVAGVVPGLLSILIVPWIASRLNPPSITHTPQAPEFARSELAKMGRVTRNEWIVFAVFTTVVWFWINAGNYGIDVTITALAGATVLLVAGVLDWKDVLGDQTAWDIFIWYGGMVRLGRALGETGVPTEFAKAIGDRAVDLLLRALRVRLDHRAFAGHVYTVRRGADRQRSARGIGCLCVRDLHQPRLRTHQLRHHTVTDVLCARLRPAQNLVESGIHLLVGEPRHLGNGGVRLVEVSGHLVTLRAFPYGLPDSLGTPARVPRGCS